MTSIIIAMVDQSNIFVGNDLMSWWCQVSSFKSKINNDIAIVDQSNIFVRNNLMSWWCQVLLCSDWLIRTVNAVIITNETIMQDDCPGTDWYGHLDFVVNGGKINWLGRVYCVPIGKAIISPFNLIDCVSQ